MRIVLHLRLLVEHRSQARIVHEEDARQALRELVGDFLDGRHVARARRAFDLEVIAVVVMELLQRLSMMRKFTGIQIGPRQLELPPNSVGVRLAGLVVDLQIHAVQVIDVGLLLVRLRQRTHAVRRQELGLVEQAPQDLLHAMAAQQRQQPA